MNTYAFIFARGGSKGLPGKNVMPLGEFPLVAHSIRSAQANRHISKVFVSTDDREIAAIAEKYGAELIFRPAELASDSAPEWLAWRHAVEEVQGRFGDFERFISLPATSPLRSDEDITGCLDALTADIDVVVTVTPASRNPWFNMVVFNPDDTCRLIMDGSEFHRRQDAPEVFDMTTVAYVTRPEFVIESDGVFTGRVTAVVVPKERAIDIDDKYDFLMAQAVYQA